MISEIEFSKLLATNQIDDWISNSSEKQEPTNVTRELYISIFPEKGNLLKAYQVCLPILMANNLHFKVVNPNKLGALYDDKNFDEKDVRGKEIRITLQDNQNDLQGEFYSKLLSDCWAALNKAGVRLAYVPSPLFQATPIGIYSSEFILERQYIDSPFSYFASEKTDNREFYLDKVSFNGIEQDFLVTLETSRLQYYHERSKVIDEKLEQLRKAIEEIPVEEISEDIFGNRKALDIWNDYCSHAPAKPGIAKKAIRAWFKEYQYDIDACDNEIQKKILSNHKLMEDIFKQVNNLVLEREMAKDYIRLSKYYLDAKNTPRFSERYFLSKQKLWKFLEETPFVSLDQASEEHELSTITANVNLLPKNSEMYRLVDKLLSQIGDIVINISETDDDYEQCTKVLEQTVEVLASRGKDTYYDQLGKYLALANELYTKPSAAWKAVSGTMSAIGSVLLIIFGIGVSVGSFGAASPVGIALAAAGTASLLGGVGLFGYKRRQEANTELTPKQEVGRTMHEIVTAVTA